MMLMMFRTGDNDPKSNRAPRNKERNSQSGEKEGLKDRPESGAAEAFRHHPAHQQLGRAEPGGDAQEFRAVVPPAAGNDDDLLLRAEATEFDDGIDERHSVGSHAARTVLCGPLQVQTQAPAASSGHRVAGWRDGWQVSYKTR